MKPITTLGPGLLIGIPTLGRPVPIEWAMAFKALGPPINFNVNFSIIRGQEVGAAREAFADQAIKLGAKYLFFLSDDVEVPPHALRQMLFRMENNPNLGVVGGIYCSKCDPPAPLVFRENGVGSYWDWKIGEFFECTGLGMDCTLIRTEVFSKLTKPYFKTVDDNKFLDGINAAEAWTEDLFFCNKVLAETDYKIYADASIICNHWDVYNNKSYSLPSNSLPMRQKVTYFEKNCLILGPPLELNEPYNVVVCNESNEADYRIQFDNLPFEKDQFDWVIVTHPQESLKSLPEWQRVSKGKVSICVHPWISIDFVAKALGAKIDGNYIELTKDGGTVL